MADYNSDRTGSNIDLTLDKVDALDAKVQPTATGANVTGTVTADGLVVDGDGTIGSGGNGANNAVLTINSTSSTSHGGLIRGKKDGSNVYLTGELSGMIGSGEGYATWVYNSNPFNVYTGNTKSLTVAGSGDVSFYENTGTTAKMVWDASAERLGVGTSSPRSLLNVTGTGADGGILTLENNSTSLTTGRALGQLDFYSNDGSTNGTGVKANIQAIALNSIGNEVGLTFGTAGTSSSSSVERMRIDSAGNVGIGGVPTAKLDVNGVSVYPKVKIQASTNTSRFMQLGMDNATEYSIEANGAGTNLLFKTVGTERARIDSSGNLLVGMTAPSNATAGMYVRPSSSSGFMGDNTNAINLGRLNSDGVIANFLKDGNPVGSIGTTGGALDIKNAVAGGVAVTYENSTNALLVPILTNGSFADGLHDLGRTNARFKDLYLSGGVYLGGTGAANKLDDYEEGDWTPDLRFGGLATGITYNPSYRFCSYTKVGRTVTCRVGVFLTSKGTATGSATIGGLPFTIKSLSYRDATCAMGYGSMSGMGTAGAIGAGRNGADILDLRQYADVSISAITNTNFTNNTFIFATFVYDTDQ